MGFLDPAPSDATAPQEEKPFGGFLSDNPPPSPPDPTMQKAPIPEDIGGYALGMATNVPESGKKFASDIWQAVSHPQETLGALGNLYLGLMQKASPEVVEKLDPGQDYSKYPEAVGKLLVDRYGSVENAKRTLYEDPVGTLGDISTVLYGGAGAATKVPYLGKTLATAAKVTDPLTVPTAGMKLAGKGAAATLGYDTGAGMRNIEEAAKAGYEGGDAARMFSYHQSGLGTPEELINYANTAIQNLRKERGATYTVGMQAVGQNQQILSFNDIGQAMADAHKVKTYKGISLDPPTEAIRSQLDDAVIRWVQLNPADYHTPEGFDALKQMVGHIRDAQKPGTPERFVADKYYNAIRNTIAKQVPEYAKIMEGYSEASDLLSQIERTLSLPRDQRRLNVDTALRKLQSVLRRNVNTNYGQREKLIEYLEAAGSPHLKAAIAGQALSSPEAHGIVRVLPALKSLDFKNIGEAVGALGITSPLISGRLAFNAGRLARPLKYVPPHTLEAARQLGRLEQDTPEFKRGGPVARALRLARKH